MNGKVFVAVLVACALIAGGALYYLQVYGYYEEIAATGPADLRATTTDGTLSNLPHDGFRAIDSFSSPVRYRACFDTYLTPEDLRAAYRPYPDAVPLVAPGWFDCFDAAAIGAALESGQAVAVMGTEEIAYGVDRVVAVGPNGRGWVWHQINACGREVFDGNAAPEGCPEPPERTN